MARPAFAQGPLAWSDDFAGYTNGDVNTVTGGAWAGPVVTGDQVGRIDAGDLIRGTASGWGGAYTTKADFGRDTDFVWEIAAKPGDGLQMLLYMLAVPAASGGNTGYVLNISAVASANDRFRLQRWNANTVAATHVDVSDAELGNGDALGLRVRGDGVLQFMRRQAGTWSQIGSDVTDATLTAGRVMLESNSGATRIGSISAYNAADVAAADHSGLLLRGCG